MRVPFIVALSLLLAATAESSMLLYNLGLMSGRPKDQQRPPFNPYLMMMKDSDVPLSSLSHDELQKLKWWKDKRPSMLISRWDHR